MGTTGENHKYDDIIHLPHPVSGRHARMSMVDRGAQFSPFAALTGYDAVIQETARLTEDSAELDESAKAALDKKLQMLLQAIDAQPEATFLCFQPDQRKTGGAYVRVTGRVKKIDPYEQAVLLTDKTVIPIDRIYEIEGEWLCPDFEDG